MHRRVDAGVTKCVVAAATQIVHSRQRTVKGLEQIRGVGTAEGFKICQQVFFSVCAGAYVNVVRILVGHGYAKVDAVAISEVAVTVLGGVVSRATG